MAIAPATVIPSASSDAPSPGGLPASRTPPRNPAPVSDASAYRPTIVPTDFGTRIDAPRFPLVPGTTFVYDGGGEHTETTVTAKRRTIMGVSTVVVRDRVFEGSALIEDTEDYYAQDLAGNVWYFGEDTAECQDGKPGSRDGAWVGGVDGAQPGVVMLADARPDDRYRQEYLAGQAEDQARIVGTEPSVTVPAGTYANVLVTEEDTPLEPDVLEQKVYASGVGLVEERTIKGGSGLVRLTEIQTDAPTADTSPSFRPCQA